MEFYLYDFSEFDGDDLDDHACFVYGDLDYFWFEPTHAAFLATVDGHLAGVVLVDNDVKLAGNERSICEFFVMRKYRRRGVGRTMAQEVFRRLPATWEIAVKASNMPAQIFWQKVISEYSQGVFQEVMLDNDEWEGPVFSLDNRQ